MGFSHFAVLVAAACLPSLASTARTAEALRNATSSSRGPARAAMVRVDSGAERLAVQGLLDVLAREMTSATAVPLEQFAPLCMNHVQRLVQSMDEAYTDSMLLMMLLHECELVKDFPSAYGHGFKSHAACQSFSHKLMDARIAFLKDGSNEHYQQFCTDYYNVRGSVDYTPPSSPAKQLPGPAGPAQERRPSTPETEPVDVAEAATKEQPWKEAAEPGEPEPGPATAVAPAPAKKQRLDEPPKAKAEDSEPEFRPMQPESDEDKRIESEMQKMKDKIDKEIKTSNSGKDGGKGGKAPAPAPPAPVETKHKTAAKPKKKEIEKQDQDFVEDGGSSDRVEKAVAEQSPQDEEAEPVEKPPALSPWAERRIKESRKERKFKESRVREVEGKKEDASNKWANMRERAKKRKAEPCSEDEGSYGTISREERRNQKGSGAEWEDTGMQKKEPLPGRTSRPLRQSGASVSTSSMSPVLLAIIGLLMRIF